MPTIPGAPTPATPPGSPAAPARPPEPETPVTPAPNLNLNNNNNDGTLATAAPRGGEAQRSALPQVFGDLFGGGFVAGPLPVVVNSAGQIVSPLPIVVNTATGQKSVLSVPGARPAPTDELLLGRPATGARGSNATTIAVSPGPGQVFDQSLAAFVSRVPQVSRGAFKITENDTPRPTTRAYFTYNFYDYIGKGIGGPDVPRIMLHQETFGYEQALGGGQYSLGLRLPYNQIVSTGFLNSSMLGDITLTSKFILRENEHGDLLSGGMLLTVPTGSNPFPSSLTGTNVRGVLFQPYLGGILLGEDGRAFVQGFSSIIIPSDSDDTTFLSNSVNIGYKVIDNAQGRISSVVPIFEMHLNTPLNHRGTRSDPVGFVDTFTVLAGNHILFRNGLSVGAACGTPITGPRPFSLQATLQVNYRF
ncbi:hypothetical protein [Limnoglobus roseus]|uniref:hypothetical protein n=1 Tax=Limnoglobus roseus TaxID=2598579 RepID=UPI0011EB2E45|nr:hypothetical protein [Limnoglobus roseus]